MQWKSTSPRSTGLVQAGWVLLFVLVAAGVFWLPYHVPVAAAVVSDSVQFGFNNRVALAAVLVGLMAATIFSVFAPLVRQGDAGETGEGQIGIGPLLLVCGIQTALYLPLNWIAEGSPPIGEAAYFLPRLYYMTHGLAPYRDFEFAYGPVMAYVARGLQQVLGLSLQSAFTLSAWVFGVVGYTILWGLLRQARAGRRAKLAALICLAAWFHLAPAPQYTLLRFLCGFGALSLAAAITGKVQARWYLLPPVYLALTMGVLAISPEIGCAFIPVLLTYLILEFGPGRRFFQTASVYLALTGFAAGLLPGEMFLVLRGFAAGGNAFPVLPSAYVLLYLGTLMAVFPSLLACGPKILRGSKVEVRPFGGPLTLAFAVSSICLIPGAMGRADFGHVYFYGIGVFLLGVLGSWPRARWQMAYWGTLVVVFQGIGFVMLFNFLPGEYASAAGQRALRWVEAHPASAVVHYGRSIAGDARWNAFLARTRHVRDLSLETNYAALSGIGPICTPLGDPAAYSVLADHDNLKPEYFYSVTNVFTPEQIERKVDDTRYCNYLVQRFGARDEFGAPIEIAESPTQISLPFLRWILNFPWLPRLAEMPDPYTALRRNEIADYVPIKQVNERWFLWARRVESHQQ